MKIEDFTSGDVNKLLFTEENRQCLEYLIDKNCQKFLNTIKDSERIRPSRLQSILEEVSVEVNKLYPRCNHSLPKISEYSFFNIRGTRKSYHIIPALNSVAYGSLAVYTGVMAIKMLANPACIPLSLTSLILGYFALKSAKKSKKLHDRNKFRCTYNPSTQSISMSPLFSNISTISHEYTHHLQNINELDPRVGGAGAIIEGQAMLTEKIISDSYSEKYDNSAYGYLAYINISFGLVETYQEASKVLKKSERKFMSKIKEDLIRGLLRKEHAKEASPENLRRSYEKIFKKKPDEHDLGISMFLILEEKYGSTDFLEDVMKNDISKLLILNPDFEPKPK